MLPSFTTKKFLNTVRELSLTRCRVHAMKYAEPLVSVVIPTRNRPHLVARAVRSALSQSLNPIEIIVVIDGPDDDTLQILCQIEDSRLKVKIIPLHLGSGDSRNAGVSEARGHWIAFLDDDDEWFPQKLEVQLQTAQQSSHRYPIIACRLIARGEMGDCVRPRRVPGPKESVGEYLFCRKSLFWGKGLLQTSTIFTMKDLLRRVPFKSGLKKHADIDWILRASTQEGVGVEFVPRPDPLVIWHIENYRSRISNRADWRYSLSWIKTNRQLVTSRTFASFILTWVSESAVRENDRKAFLILIREACRYGKPTLIDVLLYLGIWMISTRVRRRIVAFFTR